MPIRNTMIKTRKLARKEEKAGLVIALSLSLSRRNKRTLQYHSNSPFAHEYR